MGYIQSILYCLIRKEKNQSMNTINNYFVSICIILILSSIISTIIKLRRTSNLSSINLSWIWKIGMLVLIIGISVLLFNIKNVYNNINENSDKVLVAKEVKNSIIYSFYYILMFITSIIAWISLKRYRQYIYNSKNDIN